MMSEVVVYNNGEIELKVSLKEESIWLTQKQIVELFDKNQSVISRHIRNIFKDGEVDEKSNMQKMHIANSDKPVHLYSLDIILAVGYRTNSKKAIDFRIWATKVLKEYIYNGYAINSEKITIDRFMHLEESVNSLRKEVKSLKEEKNQIQLTQGVFYNGQIYDAYVLINDIFKQAQEEVILIDNYIDDSVLTLFSKYPKLNYIIITKSISKQLNLDIKKYKAQYNNLSIKKSNRYHDRFLMLDKIKAYHIGASLKDLGKKVFAFNEIDGEMLRLDDE